MSVFLDPVIDITPGSYAGWVETDLSSYISEDATIVILRFVNTSTGSGVDDVGCRSSDSSTSILGALFDDRQVTLYCKVGTGRKIDLYIADSLIVIYLVGYFEGEAVGFTDPTDYLPGSTNVYHDIDVSGQVPEGATFAILNEISQKVGFKQAYFRANGSSDSRYAYTAVSLGVIIPLDEDRIFEYKTNDIAVTELFLIGYITTGSGHINATDKSLSSTGSWLDVDCSDDSPPANADCVFVELKAGNRIGDIRPDGYTTEIFEPIGTFGGIWATGLVNDIFEGKIGTTSLDWWIWGYSEPIGAEASKIPVFDRYYRNRRIA